MAVSNDSWGTSLVHSLGCSLGHISGKLLTRLLQTSQTKKEERRLAKGRAKKARARAREAKRKARLEKERKERAEEEASRDRTSEEEVWRRIERHFWGYRWRVWRR
ncbi:hypothetical protein ANO11243_011360 [Dothideomycetidae sp. 11243]|nr:hypothetical protein ANO11243_011360 [fungal sp. No.11243]